MVFNDDERIVCIFSIVAGVLRLQNTLTWKIHRAAEGLQGPKDMGGSETDVSSDCFFWLVVEPTHLKNMRKSNWIIFPR